MIHRLQTINRASSDLQGFFSPPPRWASLAFGGGAIVDDGDCGW
jgi:hypothetical protein